MPGQHHRHRDLKDLGGLEPNHAEVQPALRPLADLTDRQHPDEHDDAQQVEQRRPAAQLRRRDLGDRDHDREGDAETDHLRLHLGRVLIAGAVENHQPVAAQGQQSDQQRQIQMQPC